MAFSLEKLKQTVQTFQESKNTSNNEWPEVVFLPDGNHKVRFITDPEDEVFIQYWSYGYFFRGIRDPQSIDPKDLPENFVNELAEIYEKELAPLQKWSYNAKHNTIMYLYLYETDSPSENWQPDNLYVVVTSGAGGKKFAESIVNFLSSMATDAPEEILKILNPAEKGHLLTLSYTGGKDGNCSIGAAFPNKIKDPIDMTGRPFVPLQQAYIKPGFFQEKYDNLVKKYKEDAIKLRAARGAIPDGTTGTAEGGENNTPPDVGATGGNSMVAQQPVESQVPVQEAAAISNTVTETPAQVAQVAQEAANTPAESESTTTSAPASGSVWAKFQPAAK